MLIESNDGEGHRSKAYIDAVGFGEIAEQLAWLPKGSAATVIGRLNSHKRGEGKPWRTRLVCEAIDVSES